jgi:hypothetical protein
VINYGNIITLQNCDRLYCYAATATSTVLSIIEDYYDE